MLKLETIASRRITGILDPHQARFTQTVPALAAQRYVHFTGGVQRRAAVTEKATATDVLGNRRNFESMTGLRLAPQYQGYL